jgi:hypothetical protein
MLKLIGLRVQQDLDSRFACNFSCLRLCVRIL